MKLLIEKILIFLARNVIQKYQPLIVGITGSVGKTSTKYAVKTVLKKKYRVRADSKSLNTEIGFPLAILGKDIPGKSIFGWIKIFLSGFLLLLFRQKNFPEVLVLEYGADKPGDISFLTSIARPDIAMITGVGPTHLEFFKNVEAVVREKSVLAKRVKKGGTVILHADFPLLHPLEDELEERVLTYGFSSDAHISPRDIVQKWGEGIMFKAMCGGSVVPIFLKESAGEAHIGVVLGAIAVGVTLQMNLIEIGEALREYTPPPGRMRYVLGVKNTILIDDSYNSSPVALKKALEFLSLYPTDRRIAVLGDMNELGNDSDFYHEEAGRWVSQYGFDYLLTVGAQAKKIARSAIETGMDPKSIALFDKVKEAGHFLQEIMKEGDAILFKGSQNGIFLEEAVKEVMLEPLRAKELLVRQSDDWLQIKKKKGYLS